MELDKEHIRTEIKELKHIDDFKNSIPDHYQCIAQICQVEIGSHVYYENHGGHHGIIVEKEDHKITLMRYRIRNIIDKEYIVMKDGHFCVVKYGTHVPIQLQLAVYNGPVFSSLSVVHRAFARFKEQQYGRIRNHGWGFPQWCRTGYGGFTYCDIPQLGECEQRITDASDLSRGDHIMIKYWFSSSQNDIVLSADGNNIKVIHFRSGGKGTEIEERTIKLSSGDWMYRVIYRRDATSNPDLVVLRAKAMVVAQRCYKLLPSHCQYLATWCKTGVWQGSRVSCIMPVKDQMDQLLKAKCN